MSEFITNYPNHVEPSKPGDHGKKCEYTKPEKHEFCGEVKNSKTLCECPTAPVTPYTTVGHIVTKIPVVLAERTVQIDVESDILLDKPAIEIKRIYKSLFLTQCRLLPKVGKLFLSGYIRKNIEYATADCVKNGTIAGDIRHTTVNVPFECVTFIPNELGVTAQFTDNSGPFIFQDFSPELMGNSRKETDQENFQFFNEKVYCELVSARFNEVDIQKKCSPIKHDEKGRGYSDGYCDDSDFSYEYSFQKVTEKMTVLLTFKLLQLQQVKINGLC